MMNKKRLLIILICAVLVAIGLFLFLRQNKPATKIDDDGGPPTSGLVDPENALLNVSTDKDFFAIQDAIMQFLISQKLDPSTIVTVKSVTSPERDGLNITLLVDVPNLQKEPLTILINYGADPTPTLSVPSKNYTAPLYGGSD